MLKPLLKEVIRNQIQDTLEEKVNTTLSQNVQQVWNMFDNNFELFAMESDDGIKQLDLIKKSQLRLQQERYVNLLNYQNYFSHISSFLILETSKNTILINELIESFSKTT